MADAAPTGGDRHATERRISCYGALGLAGFEMAERKDDRDRSEQARRDLERLSEEGGLLNTPKLKAKTDSVRDHLAAADTDQDDRIEVWGTRIGRWLSVVVFVLLALWLFNFFTRN